ncbi:MAG: hypothetical protein WCF44_07850 [Candidatus Methylophosphatis roskildensis]
MIRRSLSGQVGGRLAAICCAVLSACSQAPVAVDSSGESALPALHDSPNAAFEQQQRERAKDLTRQGAFGEAAIAWEVLTLLRPDVVEYAENLQRIRSRIEARVVQRILAADQARRRGEADQAAQLYLQALADDPLNAQAAQALRAIERERNKRNYLGKPSRLTLARYATAEAERSRAASSSVDRNDLEHASLLMHQSEYAEAIGILERYVKVFPQDETARKALAEACYQMAERKQANEPRAAQALLQRAVKLDPAHDQAAKRLRQLGAAHGRTPQAVPAARR